MACAELPSPPFDEEMSDVKPDLGRMMLEEGDKGDTDREGRIRDHFRSFNYSFMDL